jgi:hypothetical protein
MTRLLLAFLLLCWPCVTARGYAARADGPSAVDWRGHLGPARNQSGCGGTCWAFAATAVVEAMVSIETGQRVDLSEMAMVACARHTTGSIGDWLTANGLPAERSLPYGETCAALSRDDCDALTAGGYRMARCEAVAQNVAALRAAIQQGPIYAVFTMMSDFATYQGGVYEWQRGWPDGMHSVALVGYQDTPGAYGGGWFIVRNSSGPEWGEDGYVRIGYSQVSNQVGLGIGAYRCWGVVAAPPVDVWYFPWVRRFADGV